MSARVRLCLKDLFHQDVVEMIERETRKYQIWEVTTPDDPDFAKAYALLWGAFGAVGEMEREEAIRSFLLDDPYVPTKDGTYILYFLLVAKDAEGNIRGVRDGSILVNPAYAADLCVVYLSHIFMLPEARGTVLSYWLRITPVEIAMRYLLELHGRGQLKTAQTICYEILREILREAKQFNAREFRILAAQPVIDLFLDEESQSLAQLGDFIGKPISLQVESIYTQEQYDIVLI